MKQASSVDFWWLLASIREFMTCRLAEGRLLGLICRS
jgi:hypothetical protein